jgi:hypothetical protein
MLFGKKYLRNQLLTDLVVIDLNLVEKIIVRFLQLSLGKLKSLDDITDIRIRLIHKNRKFDQ